MNIAVIPARGGSTRIPGKNIRLFHGKPIIAYSIETARASGLFDKIIVSTDSTHITAVAKAYGAKIHNRAAKLCENEIGTQEVMASVLRWWQSSPHTTMPEFVCCIYATAPLMLHHDLRAGMQILRAGSAKYVYTVDDKDEDIGQWYIGRPKSFLDNVPLSGEHSMRMVIPPRRCCDINIEEDWQRAELLYAELRSGVPGDEKIDKRILKELDHEQRGA